MRSVEVHGTLAPGGQLIVSADQLQSVPPGEPLRITLHWGVTDAEERGWIEESRMRFEAAYAPEDAIYDELNDEASTR